MNIQNKLKETGEMRANKFYSVPSVLKEEKLYNVFLRCREPEMHKLIGL
jgi:hypothetical protein